jgi:rRNA maturation RNase YbeY
MIEINNLTDFNIDKNLLKKVSEVVLKKESIGKNELSIALVGSDKIKEINYNYRKKKKPTDVLSFDSNENIPGILQENFLGEIVICPEEVKKGSEESKISFERELIKVLIHGILHLIGFDHEDSEVNAQKMRGKEKKYLNEVLTFYEK